MKLSGPFSVSDSAIAAVVSLAIYQQVHRQPTTGLVHLYGLHRMIQLRGGITRLMQENRALALKPLRYVKVLDFTTCIEFAWDLQCDSLLHGTLWFRSNDFQARCRIGNANGHPNPVLWQRSARSTDPMRPRRQQRTVLQSSFLDATHHAQSIKLLKAAQRGGNKTETEAKSS